jgi:nucleoporin POM34
MSAMATITASPSTPATVPPAAPTPPPPTGTWEHPRADEIARRKQAVTLNSQKIRNSITNGLVLLCTFVIPQILPKGLT